LWRVNQPFIPALYGCNRDVECTSSAFWCQLGYALQGERVFGKLEATAGQLSYIAHMADGSIVCDEVYLVKAEC
jgi:hypothetical protein